MFQSGGYEVGTPGSVEEKVRPCSGWEYILLDVTVAPTGVPSGPQSERVGWVSHLGTGFDQHLVSLSCPSRVELTPTTHQDTPYLASL